MPNKPDIDAISSSFAATMLESLPQMECKTITHTFPTATPDALDLIRICFHFNPEKRPSAEELLCHEYVAEFHNEEEEPVYPGGPLILPIDDNTKLTAAQYRYVLYVYVCICIMCYIVYMVCVVYIRMCMFRHVYCCLCYHLCFICCMSSYELRFLLYFSPYLSIHIYRDRLYDQITERRRERREDKEAK